jgi:xylulokinase
MALFLGIDIGTSGVKAVLVDERDKVAAEAGAPLAVSRPRPLWSEQAPEDWWRATAATLDALAERHPELMRRVQAIGLSGQMLGVTLLDSDGRALRPALLWNDGRAEREGAELEALIPDFAGLTGARAMPGFPAPKLRWLAKHEPETLERARSILMPKDFVRLRLTRETACDRADASATLLMDTVAGEWSLAILDNVGIDRGRLPRLAESAEVIGALAREHADRWGLQPWTPVIAGAGDNMCGGIGAGVIRPGQAFISLGTSGVYFLANDRFVPSRGSGMHTHRHALPGLYCQQGCILSAAGALAWIAGILGEEDVAGLIASVEAAGCVIATTPVFTPYLSGERTPHDDPHLTAAFSGLTLSTTRADLVHAVLEGVALAFADCHRALTSTGAMIDELLLIGGGARSRLWARLIASAIDLPLIVPSNATVGPALGAARLARLALGLPLLADGSDAAAETVTPSEAMAEALAEKRARYESHRAIMGVDPCRPSVNDRDTPVHVMRDERRG